MQAEQQYEDDVKAEKAAKKAAARKEPPAPEDIPLTREDAVGIRMPAQSNRWRFVVGGDEEFILTREVEYLTLDYVAGELTVIVRQPLVGFDVHQIISELSGHPVLVSVDMMSGNTALPVHQLKFKTKLVSHVFRLDYASDDVAKHVLVFKI